MHTNTSQIQNPLCYHFPPTTAAIILNPTSTITSSSFSSLTAMLLLLLHYRMHSNTLSLPHPASACYHSHLPLQSLDNKTSKTHLHPFCISMRHSDTPMHSSPVYLPASWQLRPPSEESKNNTQPCHQHHTPCYLREPGSPSIVGEVLVNMCPQMNIHAERNSIEYPSLLSHR